MDAVSLSMHLHLCLNKTWNAVALKCGRGVGLLMDLLSLEVRFMHFCITTPAILG